MDNSEGKIWFVDDEKSIVNIFLLEENIMPVIATHYENIGSLKVPEEAVSLVICDGLYGDWKKVKELGASERFVLYSSDPVILQEAGEQGANNHLKSVQIMRDFQVMKAMYLPPQPSIIFFDDDEFIVSCLKSLAREKGLNLEAMLVRPEDEISVPAWARLVLSDSLAGGWKQICAQSEAAGIQYILSSSNDLEVRKAKEIGISAYVRDVRHPYEQMINAITKGLEKSFK